MIYNNECLLLWITGAHVFLGGARIDGQYMTSCNQVLRSATLTMTNQNFKNQQTKSQPFRHRNKNGVRWQDKSSPLVRGLGAF